MARNKVEKEPARKPNPSDSKPIDEEREPRRPTGYNTRSSAGSSGVGRCRVVPFRRMRLFSEYGDSFRGDVHGRWRLVTATFRHSAKPCSPLPPKKKSTLPLWDTVLFIAGAGLEPATSGL